MAGESSSGSDWGITHFFMATRNTIKGVGEKGTTNKRTIWAWVNSSARRLSCDTLHSFCICRLTLAWISSEISTKLLGMLTNLDWSSLVLLLDSISCRLVSSAVRCRLPTALLRLPLLTAFCRFLPPTPLWLAFPCPLPVASRSRAQAFVWFRAKTNKGIICLADHPLHGVTSYFKVRLTPHLTRTAISSLPNNSSNLTDLKLNSCNGAYVQYIWGVFSKSHQNIDHQCWVLKTANPSHPG